MYYTAQSKECPTIHCIGAATSNNADGPYTPRDRALKCHPKYAVPLFPPFPHTRQPPSKTNVLPSDNSDGGVIDPSGFQDANGQQYLLYKVDGNTLGHGGSCGNTVAPIQPTPIMIQQVAAADGYTLISGPKQLLDRSSADGPLVEAPSLIRVKDDNAEGGWMYVLFFSSHCYSGGKYDVRYATSVQGLFNGGRDYRKAETPLLGTGAAGGRLHAPGGLQVSSDVVFHADKDGSAMVRQMWKGKIEVKGREVSI
jgi:hypothetical protein